MRPLEELLTVYRQSVGRNSNLILNATPGPDGLIPASHRRRYEELGREIQRRYGAPVAETFGAGTSVVLALPGPTMINGAIVQEDIALRPDGSPGERVRRYRLEAGTPGGDWQTVSAGTCIGHKKIDTFAPVTATHLRLSCDESVGEPLIRRLAALTEA
jgi:alpha-L-fucosidase